MRINIQSDLFYDMNNLKDVNYLISFLSDDRRHDVFCEINEVKETEVYNNLIADLKKVIELNYINFITSSQNAQLNIGNDNNENTMNISEAKKYLEQRFEIILENSLYDGYFIDSLIRNFKMRGKKILKHKEKGWLCYGNAGGCNNIINYITRIMEGFNEYPKDRNKYLRLFVLIDSDKKFESEEPSITRKRTFEFLVNNDIKYYQLEKREMENYIPETAIQSISDDYLRAYLTLSPIQKDYFDLEKGFNDKSYDNLKPEIQEQYSNLAEETYSILRKGIQSEPYKSKFKSEFPKLFNAQEVTQESLLFRVSHQKNNPNEIQAILDRITELL